MERSARRRPANGSRTTRTLRNRARDPRASLLAGLRALRSGDFSLRLDDTDGDSVAAQIAREYNAVADRFAGMTSEIQRVSRMVGRDGKIDERAYIEGAQGAWARKLDAINSLVTEIVSPTLEMARVISAVAQGDLSQKMTLQVSGRPLKGELGRIGEMVNVFVDQLREISSEVTRVAREVGSEGDLGARADVRGVSGSWRELTNSVNMLAGNLKNQVRNIALVTTAVANGDLSQKITVSARGEILELKNTINSMVDQLRTFAAEVTRVAREVGTEGKLGGQADVKGVSGTWKDLTDSVNTLAGNLTDQVRNIALVTTAVAGGDLSRKITVDAKGEILELKSTINSMVDQLRTFAAEVTRVAREVGTEGRLGGQANVQGVSGTWKDLTDSVNTMAGNLTSQVRGIVKVVTAVANGDLTQEFVAEARGEIAELADTINNMTGTLRVFAEQVTTVAREVGIEGKLGGQARVPGAAGTWRDLTDNVNVLAGNLTSQVRNIALVVTAIANGDLSRTITVDAKGEILELKATINETVETLRTFAAEVTRVARDVGTEGKLGGQASVPGVAGTWRDLTDNVNLMASNLTDQVRGIAKVVTAVADGDLTRKLVVEARGEIAELADTINDMTDTLRVFAEQVTTVAREVGIEGKLGGQARVPGAAGTWRDLTDNVNMLAGNLTSQVRNIALVTTAVANGDLSRQITVGAQGEILELKNTINIMVEQLRAFAAEVTRVAREVGTEGKLGGQAQVPGVAGTWKDLTYNVNQMASNLTSQVRGIAKVVTAVATGDLTKKLTVEAKGEIAALADTINDMTDTLRIFAEQVTTVAREVGIEGKLGGQARVPGAAGTWRDLVDNVNQLAGNLTTQVRAISEVASAVTKGDLTRTIDVAAQGEVLALRDTIAQMIANLRDTTETNKAQDWLKTNLAVFTAMMQGQRSIESLAQLIMSELTPVVSAQLGTFFVAEGSGAGTILKLLTTYGYTRRKHLSNRYALGEGLVGQAAFEKKPIIVSQVPEDYVQIASSLGEAIPRNLIVLPILFEGEVKGVVELGSFRPFSAIHLTFLEQLTLSIGVVLNMINASRRTEELLKEIKGSNIELEERTRELEEKATLLEVKNREIAEASASLEDKAKQLALVSRYKSEFLANMSHELRTPLNSMLLLANLLSENEPKNLSPEQVEYATTIYQSGRDLLSLIDQILDLSKIEAGRMQIDRRPLPLAELRAYIERGFRQLAQQKRLGFAITIAPEVPPAIVTDPQRLEQVLKNLLSNAFKFTERGHVELRVRLQEQDPGYRTQSLKSAARVVAFAVSDTGIGIPPDKQLVVFEAFQQADASTARTYGGTGLGLTISRELARLLGGEIHLTSEVGVGSTFTLYLPVEPAGERAPGQEEPQGFERTHAEPEPRRVPAAIAGRAPAEGEPEQRLTGRRILVVDDDVRNLFAVTTLLEHRGMQVTPARGGREALERLDREREIELVLLDLMMPEVDGFAVARAIRADPTLRHLPIVALTAKAMPGDRDKAVEAGCDDFVAKPVQASALLEVMARRLPARVEP